MSVRAAFPEGSHEVLAALRREVKTKAEFQRVQAVGLRVTLGLSDEQIAQAVGLSANTVRCLSSRFRCQGASALAGEGRGGRRHENLTVAQEQALLQPFLEPGPRTPPAGQPHQDGLRAGRWPPCSPVDDLSSARTPRLAQAGPTAASPEGGQRTTAGV